MRSEARLLTSMFAMLAVVIPSQGLTAQEPPPSTVEEGMAGMEVLAGRTWEARGTGYATALTYAWALPGHVLKASNVVTSSEGDILARYEGLYAWDAGRGEIAFFTATEGGEVHRGRAWWTDGVLWHEAEVSGGRLSAYASAIRPTENGFEYFADYESATATQALLSTEPLTYSEKR
jgi:hypothetical protein